MKAYFTFGIAQKRQFQLERFKENLGKMAMASPLFVK